MRLHRASLAQRQGSTRKGALHFFQRVSGATYAGARLEVLINVNESGRLVNTIFGRWLIRLCWFCALFI